MTKAIVLTMVFVLAVQSGFCGRSEAQESVGVIVEDFWGQPILRSMVKTLAGQDDAKVALEPDELDLQGFISGRCQVVAMSLKPPTDPKAWIYGFPAKQMSKTAYIVGQAKVLVVVNKNSSINALTQAQMQKLLGSGGQDDIIGGAKLHVFGEAKNSICQQVIRSTVMRTGPREKGNSFAAFGDNWRECPDGASVVESVKADVTGLGFFLCRGPVAGVKILGIRDIANKRDIQPRNDTFIDPDYPLAEPLVLYLHPSQPAAGKRLCDMVMSDEGLSIAEKFGLITSRMERQAEGRARLADMLAGKGMRITGVGCTVAKGVTSDVTASYVSAKATVQVSYSPMESDIAAIGQFVQEIASDDPAPTSRPTSMPASMPTTALAVPATSPFVKAGGKELLFLADRPSDAAMKAHGDTWNALGVDKDGKPNGSGPTEFVLAGRVVGIVVNPTNKLESLTLEQVQAIFGGEVDDWAIIGSTGLTASGATGASLGAKGVIRINAFGLRANDPATGVFEKECLAAGKWKRVTAKKDTAEAIAAVSIDPQGIAFVDLSAIPATGQTVKVLGIRMNAGKDTDGKPTTKVFMPTAENIKTAMYPLSGRVFMYVHPKATDTAKDFAKFIATCGGSEASPYADTVKAVMDTYQKNGLIPLADAAIARTAKDAAAAAKAKETATKPAKTTGK